MEEDWGNEKIMVGYIFRKMAKGWCLDRKIYSFTSWTNLKFLQYMYILKDLIKSHTTWIVHKETSAPSSNRRTNIHIRTIIQTKSLRA